MSQLRTQTNDERQDVAPPQPVSADGNDNTERDPTIWVQKSVYVGSDQPPVTNSSNHQQLEAKVLKA